MTILAFNVGTLSLSVIVLHAASAQECSPTTPFRQHNATTFFQTDTYVLSSGHAFSPDGTKLLLTSDHSGVFNVYAQSVAGGDPQPLTASTSDAIWGLSYFPNDERILFESDQGGNELFHVFVREEDGSTADLIGNNVEGARASFGGWHEDGTSFYVLSNERDPRFFDIYRYSADPAAGEQPREMILQNDDGMDVAAISPNGRWVALHKARTTGDTDLYLVDLSSENRTAELITEHEGDIKHGVYDFTRDSTALMYSTDEYGEFQQAWTYDLDTEEKSVLMEADWDVTYVFLSPSGRYRISGVNADAQTEVTIVDTATGEELELPDLPAGDIRQVHFSAEEDTLALLINSDVAPSNVFVVSLESGDLLQLTNALPPEICQYHLVEGEVVRYNSFDGLDIPSILYKPKDASSHNKAPALVWVHGGPGGQSRKGYRAAFQHLLNHGFAILAPNNRGSSGYGKTFYHMDDKRHGEVDLQDIVYGKTFLQELDWIDPDRIGIIGVSYGGYMVVAALAFEPDVFDVGIDIVGVTNWIRTLKSMPPYWEAYREALYDEMGDPSTDEERLHRISPLFHAHQIKKPLLVVQGANDPRVLQVESDELVEALKANDVPVEYLLFEDEGHGFTKKSNRIIASDAYVSFLNEYLLRSGMIEEDPAVEVAADTSSSKGAHMHASVNIFHRLAIAVAALRFMDYCI